MPRVCNCPPGPVASSAVDEVVALAASAGLILDPWQCFVLEVMLRERPDGRWLAREVAYLVARQNGKGGVLDALCLAALFLFDDENEILFSAHEFKTAKKAYRGLKNLIKRTPHLYAQVERRGTRVVGFRQSNEDTSITLRNGCVLRFMARSSNTGRGFSSQRLIVDEAQECSEETRQALQYIVSAQPNPQIIFTGTVPDPERNNGEVFESLRDRGRAGGDTTLSWMEWTPDAPDDTDIESLIDEIEAWLATNPGLPYRITTETIEAERNAATTDRARRGFCRERLSWWPGGKGGPTYTVIPEQDWKTAHQVVDLADPVAMAIDVSPDGESAAIAAAGTAVGRAPAAAVEVIAHHPGTAWVANELAGIVARQKPKCVMVAADSPAAALLPDLERAGIEVTVVATTDHKRAVAALRSGVIERRVLHRAQPELTAAVAAGVRKTLGDGWLWSRRSSAEDICPIVAAGLAHWGHLQVEDPPTEVGYIAARR